MRVCSHSYKIGSSPKDFGQLTANCKESSGAKINVKYKK